MKRVVVVAVAGLMGCSDSVGPGGEPAGDLEVAVNGPLGGLVFPADNWWNLDISSAPVDPGSDAFIEWVCRRGGDGTCAARAHPDFGPIPYGIPYVVVGSEQPRVTIEWTLYGEESDAGAPGQPEGYPIPPSARSEAGYIEGGVAGGGSEGDRHLLIVDRDRRLLFETWATEWSEAQGRWRAGSGAVFDLSSNARRPEGWTSADAAGLAILPGLVKFDEVSGGGEVTHAHRVTTRATNGYVWPASHQAGSTAGALPLGARLRLRASVDLTPFRPEVQRLFRSFQRYGLIVADNGSDLFIQGTMDVRWDNDVLNPAFRSLTADDFEVIELGWRPGG